MAPLIRECARYGIYIWITLNNFTSISRRMLLCIKTIFALHMKDEGSYRAIIPGRSRLVPRKDFGRGELNNGGIHEYQTAYIVPEKNDINTKLSEVGNKLNAEATVRSKKIPRLPSVVTFDIIKNEITDLTAVPIGITKETLETSKFNFTSNNSTIISGYKIDNIKIFMLSLLTVLKEIKGLTTIFIDPKKDLEDAKNLVNNYYSSDIEKTIEVLNDFTAKNKEMTNGRILFIIYGVSNLKNMLTSTINLESMFKNIQANINMNLVVADGVRQLRNIELDKWYTIIKTNTDGIWIGKGLGESQLFRLSPIPKEAALLIKDTYGFNVFEQQATLIKVIDFFDKESV